MRQQFKKLAEGRSLQAMRMGQCEHRGLGIKR
jgi:hypothetical protein